MGRAAPLDHAPCRILGLAAGAAAEGIALALATLGFAGRHRAGARCYRGPSLSTLRLFKVPHPCIRYSVLSSTGPNMNTMK